MLSAEFGVGQRRDVVAHHFLLNLNGVLPEQRDLVEALSNEPAENSIDWHFQLGSIR